MTGSLASAVASASETCSSSSSLFQSVSTRSSESDLLSLISESSTWDSSVENLVVWDLLEQGMVEQGEEEVEELIV